MPSRPLHAAIVSTYPPRPCGIGTFSRDLREALLGADGVRKVDVVAIVRDEGQEQSPEVVASVSQDRPGDYAAAARVLARRDADVVVVQHEFGIFGGPDGALAVALARELRRPMVVTLHTVLAEPSPGQAQALRGLCDEATLVTVFTERARRMVVERGIADSERVRVVPHGGPTELLPREPGHRRRLRLPRRLPAATARAIDDSGPVLATFGLISPGKGIEVAIRAMPAIVARHPNSVYLVAGQTHPGIARHHGEEYRLSLERLVRDLGLEEHVIFDNRYLSVEDLASMLAATTVYLTPYRSREQIVSGALTFAIVAGCPVVSTPYYYAEDLLATGAGRIVPFEDHAAMAGAVCDLLDQPLVLGQARRVAREIGRELAWPQVGRATAKVLREAISLGRPEDVRRPAAATLPRPREAHLMTLVDDVGIVQHAAGVVPIRASGYCVDDVARLALVALHMLRTSGGDTHARLLALSLAFLHHAWDPAGAGMHNHLSYDRRWLDVPHTGDHLGRAAWALGEVIAAGAPPAVREPSRLLLAEMLPLLAGQRSPRTMAFAMLGIAHAGPAEIGASAAGVLRDLAEWLAGQQRANASPDWHWAEDGLHYDNARCRRRSSPPARASRTRSSPPKGSERCAGTASRSASTSRTCGSSAMRVVCVPSPCRAPATSRPSTRPRSSRPTWRPSASPATNATPATRPAHSSGSSGATGSGCRCTTSPAAAATMVSARTRSTSTRGRSRRSPTSKPSTRWTLRGSRPRRGPRSSRRPSGRGSAEDLAVRG
jgi:glycosyltransferase involved in cell wall biosynthesis